MKPFTSTIWNYFVNITTDSAKCKLCEKVYSRKGGTTTSLKGHLKSLHPKEYEDFAKADTEKKLAPCSSSSGSNSTPIQEVKKQIRIQDALTKNQKWPASHQKSKEIDKLIAEMIALQDLPFNFVEGIGFKRLIKYVVPNYQLRGRQYFTTYICDEMYPKLAGKIGELLGTFDKLCFTTDIWSEPSSNVSLLSLTAHGIDEEFKRKIIILKCHTFEGRHTGDLIEEKFNNMLTEWGIDNEKIHCFVRDCGSNMIRALRLADIPNVNCTVHQLQLCARNTLESNECIKNIIAKRRRISTHFNHSQIAQSELHKVQREQLNQDALSVVQECSTRWNSTFYMVERMIKIKDSLALYASNHNIPQISPEEWVQLKKLISILQPFEEITRIMSDSTTSISPVIPLVHTLKQSLQAENSNLLDTDETFKTMIYCAMEQLNLRFGEINSDNFFAIATYLDPRYKTNFFNDVVKERVESDLLVLLDNSESQRKSPPRDRHENTDAPTEKRARLEAGGSTVQSMLSNILMSDEEEDVTTTEDNVVSKFIVLKGLLNEYNREKRIPINENPLSWWKANQKFQPLYSIVRQYLSCPPGSVASEQLFSGAGLIYDPLRNRLDGDKAAKLLFIKYNLVLLETLNLG